MKRLALVLLAAGCPKKAPVEAAPAPTEPESVALTFAWPDGGWGGRTVVRTVSDEGVSFTTTREEDVGIDTSSGQREVLFSTRSVTLEAREGRVPALVDVVVQGLPWRLLVDDQAELVGVPDRREAVAPLYDPDKDVRYTADEVFEEPGTVADDALAVFPPPHAFDDLFAARQAWWAVGLTKWAGKTVSVPQTWTDDDGAWSSDFTTCGPRDKQRCVVLTWSGTQASHRWVVEPDTMLPWASEVTLTTGTQVIEETATWSWTLR